MKVEGYKIYNSKNKVNLSIIMIVSIIIAIICTRYVITMAYGESLYEGMTATEQDIKMLLAIFAVASVIFWGISIRCILKVVKMDPVLEVDRDGIRENGGLVQWSNIEKISKFSLNTGFNTRYYLGIWVKDINLLFSSSTPLKKDEIEENILAGAAPITIAEASLEESIEDTIRRINRYRERLETEENAREEERRRISEERRRGY